MAQTIQLRRGNKANLPALRPGEPAIALDTGDIYIGGLLSNIEVPSSETVRGQVETREAKNKLYKKSVFKELPLRFPDYDSLVASEAVTYLYPQGFTIDWEGNEILILYVPSGGVSTKRWVVVYDLTTQAYKSCFSAGNAGGEGIVVKREGGVRYLYVKSSGSSLGKYNISALPTNKATLASTATYDVGLFYDFSYRNGLWLIEQQGAPVGIHVRRTNFVYFDDNFNRVSSINISPTHGGFWVGDYVNYIPKRQGMALGDGFIVQGTGGYYGKGETPIPYNYYGIKLLNADGSLREEGLLDPKKTLEILESKGYACDRIEIEGVHVAPDGEVYSLLVHQSRLMDQSYSEGVLIFREMTDDKDTIDFSSAGKVYQGFDTNYLSTGVFPRSGDGKFYDPFKGTVMDTFDKILDFMIGTDQKQFWLYGSSNTVTDINGVVVPAGTLVQIRNSNNSTFYIDYYGNPINRRYVAYGTTGARTQKEISAIPSKWAGKVWNVLGDSIEQGYLGTTPYHTLIKNEKGITVNNYGVGGTCLAIRAGVSDSMLERYPTMDNNADLITVKGGTNDHAFSIPIGTMADRVGTTFYGACHLLLDGLINKYPGKSIGVLIPIQKGDVYSAMKPYAMALKEVAQFYSLPVLDLFNEGGFPVDNLNFRATYLQDKIHPNNEGYKLLAKRVGPWIETL